MKRNQIKIVEEGLKFNFNFIIPKSNLSKSQLTKIMGGSVGCTCRRHPENFTICECDDATYITDNLR
ncbi:MAG: hypothetical protein KAT68_09080 [Bacteroidales bacterium]|nr:hypothetical protein [Bacteroidales bacterium]